MSSKVYKLFVVWCLCTALQLHSAYKHSGIGHSDVSKVNPVRDKHLVSNVSDINNHNHMFILCYISSVNYCDKYGRYAAIDRTKQDKFGTVGNTWIIQHPLQCSDYLIHIQPNFRSPEIIRYHA